MLEVEQQNLIEIKDPVFEAYQAPIDDQLISKIHHDFPQLILPMPINDPQYRFELDPHTINPIEREFAKLLVVRNLIVFREPQVINIASNPDFFIYNPQSEKGRLIEITFMERNPSKSKYNKKTIERKKRQLENLGNCGIPYSFLYRDNLESIKKYCWGDLY